MKKFKDIEDTLMKRISYRHRGISEEDLKDLLLYVRNNKSLSEVVRKINEEMQRKIDRNEEYSSSLYMDGLYDMRTVVEKAICKCIGEVK